MGTIGDDTLGSRSHGACSAVGHIRDHNEDYFLSAPERGLWIVADGMGGHAAGEVASRIACERIELAVGDGNSLANAIGEAECAIAEAAGDGEGGTNMGTTVVVARVSGHRYDIAWVGDSRAYLWHDNRLRQLTHDHSFVQELLDQNAITPEEAECHPEKSTLSRCLGGGNGGAVQSDQLSNSFFADELLILCTDGVSGEVPFGEIEQTIKDATARSATPQEISETLVKLSLDHGGNDNATVVVIAAPDDAPKRIRQTAPRKALNLPAQDQGGAFTRRRLILFFLLLVFMLVALLTIVLWPGSDSENNSAMATVYQPGQALHLTMPTARSYKTNWRIHLEENS